MKKSLSLFAILCILFSCTFRNGDSQRGHENSGYDYLKFWDINLLLDTPERADSIVRSKGYTFDKAYDDVNVYNGTFHGYPSKVIIRKGVIDSTTNKICAVRATFAVIDRNGEYDHMKTISDEMKEQIKKSHPIFSFSEKQNESNTSSPNLVFDFKYKEQGIQGYVGDITYMIDNETTIFEGTCFILDYFYHYFPETEKVDMKDF